MKISKSKQELARIVSENGGWRDGNYAVQDRDDKKVWFMRALVGRPDGASFWPGVKSRGIPYSKVLTNWHQTALSRAEYLHLYPAPGAKPEFCESVMRTIPEPEAKPTIEQLAADYRNAKDYAERKQQEADAAKNGADARLKALEIAAEDLGFKIEPITTKQDGL